MNNYMKKVAEMLGLELGEEFKLNNINGYYYKFNEDCLADIDGFKSDLTLRKILNGQYTIVKLPWKPKEGECYKCIVSDGNIYISEWKNRSIDYYRFNAHNCFKLCEVITDEIKESILKKNERKV